MLGVDDFSRFYSEVHGEPPFPWQADLVDEVLSRREWPELIDVPTGMGKTALLDVAVFVAAATAAESGDRRLGRRRTFLVVDRRIVVDEAYDRAGRLSEALERGAAASTDSAVRRVADGLRALAPKVGEPLAIPPAVPVPQRPRRLLPVTRMRGGVTWDAAWLDRPDIPGVIVGTVDQLGSRLLFRGYGVSDRRKPIDAALVGADSLVLVDEAHLAEVMVSTVMAVQGRDTAGIGVPRAVLVRMTATAGSERLRRYAINIDRHRDSPVAWRRLTASKRLSLVSSDPKQVVTAMAAQAVALLGGAHDTALVVCNTVERARQVHAALAKATTGRRALDADVSLLIGRCRPIDRDVLVAGLQKRFGVGRERRRVAGRPCSWRPRPSRWARTLMSTGS